VARDGSPTTRRAEPYRLVATAQRWYLVAYDLDRQDWRTFRVDRLKNLAVTGHTFTPRRLDDPEQLVRTALSSAPYRYRAEVRVAASPEELSRRVAPNAGIVEPDGQTSLLRVGADSLAWLVSFLFELDLPFEIVAPPELRAEFRDLLAGLAQSHEDR
jgi:predicted DNA-binding transcriptional regulator YafY